MEGQDARIFGIIVLEVVFMDIRTMIIQKVMEALRGRADEVVLGTVQDVLVMERCTEVAAMHLQEYLGSRQDD